MRGLKWYNYRGIDGLPSDIANDDGKMIDVNYYLKFKDASSEEHKTFIAMTTGKGNAEINALMESFVIEVKPEEKEWKKTEKKKKTK